PTSSEIIVVNNASNDDTASVLRTWARSASIPVTTVSQRRIGLSRARNAGINESRGRLLALTDDDCQMDRYFIRDLLQHDRMDSELVLRGGRVELGDPTDCRYTVKTDPVATTYSGDGFPGGAVLGCNLTMRRELFGKVGPFDERFGAG